MSTANLPTARPAEVMLTILSGPEAGVSYKLIGQTVTIGRDSQNDVSLLDMKASRQHARLEWRNGAYWLVDMQSRTGTILNGIACRQSILRLGDQITIGTTILRFGLPQPASILAAAPPMTAAPLFQTPADWAPIARKKNRKPLVTGLFIGGFLLYIGLQPNKKAKTALNLKDDESLQQEIQAMGEDNEQREREILKKGKDTQQYIEAQDFYMRGFREFRDSNFSRAIEDFEAALALYPQHPLAKRYLERSQLKLHETVTKAFEQGERNFQLERFNEAFANYRTVIVLLNDPNNKMFQMAQKRIEAINLILTSNR